MQNKHHFFFSFGRPNFGGGGGRPGWAKFPNFFQKLDLKAPLNIQLCTTRNWAETFCSQMLDLSI